MLPHLALRIKATYKLIGHRFLKLAVIYSTNGPSNQLFEIAKTCQTRSNNIRSTI